MNNHTPDENPSDHASHTLSSMREMPITRLLPNMLTMLSLCSGLTAIRFAMLEKWHEAVIAIVVAALFDILDGRVARMLNLTSKFGAELDSLSDAISFGVAPAIVMYLWTMHGGGSLAWVAVLVFVCCSALRLARFNTMLEDHNAPVWAKSYFTGVPAPAGAGIALIPLSLFLEFGEAAQLHPLVVAVWLIIVGGLMVSRLPTLALKGRRIAPIFVAPVMAAVCLLVAAIITEPWMTLSALGILYIALLPCGWISYQRKLAKDKKAQR